MVEHVVGVLREAVGSVVVVTSPSLDLPPLDARVVRDEEPGLGPLAGLAAGLAHVEAPLCFAVGTDSPFLTADFVHAVLAPGRAAAPVADGFVQTLAAVYPSEAAQRARELLAEGVRRPLALLEAFDYRPLQPDELPGLDSLRGFNTPAEYLAAVKQDQVGACAVLEFVGRPRVLAGCREIEVPIGSLAEVLAHAPGELELCQDERVAPGFLVSLGGRDFVRDARVPIGPGERVIVLDAAAGG
jgi:molybdopterin-guanine dinucleotide biosynthesis protein A